MKRFFQNNPPLYKEFLRTVLIVNILTVIFMAVTALAQSIDLTSEDRLLFQFIYPSFLPHWLQIHIHLGVYFIIYFSLVAGFLWMYRKYKGQAKSLGKYIPLAFILGAVQHYYVWWIEETSCSGGFCYEAEEHIVLVLVLLAVMAIILFMLGLRYMLRRSEGAAKLDKIIAFPLSYLVAAGPVYIFFAISAAGIVKYILV